MLEPKKIRPQNVIYKAHARREMPPEQNRPDSSVPGEKTDYFPGRGIGPLSISGRVGEDHRKIECSYDVLGLEYPWPTVNGEMKSSRVRLTPECHVW